MFVGSESEALDVFHVILLVLTRAYCVSRNGQCVFVVTSNGLSEFFWRGSLEDGQFRAFAPPTLNLVLKRQSRASSRRR